MLFEMTWKSLVAQLGLDPKNLVFSKVKRAFKGAVHGKSPQSLIFAHPGFGGISQANASPSILVNSES